MAQMFLLNLMAELCIRICVADAQLCPQIYRRETVSCLPKFSMLKNSGSAAVLVLKSKQLDAAAEMVLCQMMILSFLVGI